MALSTKYAAIPTPPQTGVDLWQLQMLDAIKQNVELLTAQRGESDLASAALTRASLTVSTPPAQRMTRLSAGGSGVTISGTNLPVLEDYVKALEDIQSLANDVANIRATLEVLIVQLRG